VKFVVKVAQQMSLNEHGAGEYFGVIMVTAGYFAVYYCYLFTQSFHRIYLEQEKVGICRNPRELF
jgi:hypothetical protein